MNRTTLARRAVLASAAVGLTLVTAGSLTTPAHADVSASVASTTKIPIGSASETSIGLGATIDEDAATRYPSYTYTSGLAGTITDVDVTITGFAHERPRDVDIMLESPNGTLVLLMSDVGGTTPVTGRTLTFDQQAAAEIDPAGVVQSGSWRPSNEDNQDPFPAPAPGTTPVADLSAFDGEPANGTWNLFIVDDSFDYFGSITDWSLVVRTTGNTVYPSTIAVSGRPPVVTDVDVTLTRFRHVWPTDVDVLLVGPQGQQATILSDPSGSLPNGTADLTFDDEATDTLPMSIVTGTYKPENKGAQPDVFPAPAPVPTGASSLSVFDGTDPNGVWSLYVVDDGEKEAGSIDGWSLRITTVDPQPTGGPTGPTGPVGGADTTSPLVTATSPVAKKTGVRRTADVRATLSEAVRPATVSASSAYLVPRGSTKHVRATVTWDPATRRIVIDPKRRLAAGTRYRVVVTTAVTDLAGNRLDQDATKAGQQRSTWRFTTR